MQISKITIKNFRSIESAEISADRFNIFVGQNNHGKTNFFEALNWFFRGPVKGAGLDIIRFRGAPENSEVSVEVEFTGAQDGVQKMKNETNKTKISNLISDSDVITIRRTSATDPKKRTLIINGVEKKNPAGFDSALNDFLPSFEYVSTLINPMEVTKFKANTPIGNMLSGVLAAILEQDETYAEFKKKFDELFTDPNSRVHVELENLSGQVKAYLVKQFPDCEKVVFSVSAPLFEDLLKNFESEIDDEKFIREFRSGGVVIDSYEGEDPSDGDWIAFTDDNAPSDLLFPLEQDTVYIQIRIGGTQEEILNFKLTRLTPEELELIYMDRGGSLRFSRVQ